MSTGIAIAAVGALAVAVLAATGRWRYALRPFAIGPARMTVERLGLRVATPETIERVNTVLSSFAGGVNAMMGAPSSTAWKHYCDSRPILYQPFAHEGVAMGYTVRHLFRFSPAEFEENLVRPRPEFRYLYYVGLGFWSGMRHHRPKRVMRVVAGLDPMHGYLVYDGYGFKSAFFDYPKKDAKALEHLSRLDGYARNAAYQGVGRAFFFLYMDDADEMNRRLHGLGDYAADAAAGVGLACVFVNPDRLEVARAIAAALPTDLHDHVHLGMCFGLKARSINHAAQFELDMAQLPRSVRDAVYASVRECDRVELLVRAERGSDGYEKWRSEVTGWMTRHVRYPLQEIRDPAADQSAHGPTHMLGGER